MTAKYLLEQDKIKARLNQLLNPRFMETKNPWGTAGMIAEWHKRPTPNKGGKNKTVNIPSIRETVPEIEKIETAIKPLPIAGAYVHGSYADGNAVESSDLDLIYLLSDSVCVSPKKLLNLRDALNKTTKHFLSIDKHQHHGPYMLSQKMLKNYLECYLPMAVWRMSKKLSGPEAVKFRVVKSEYHDKMWFNRSVEYYRSVAYGAVDVTQTEYDRKRFVCMANMIPCVLYPWATGEYTTKPEAVKWMVKKYPFTQDWADEIARRRLDNDFDNIDNLIKETAKICNQIKIAE